MGKVAQDLVQQIFEHLAGRRCHISAYLISFLCFYNTQEQLMAVFLFFSQITCVPEFSPFMKQDLASMAGFFIKVRTL